MPCRELQRQPDLGINNDKGAADGIAIDQDESKPAKSSIQKAENSGEKTDRSEHLTQLTLTPRKHANMATPKKTPTAKTNPKAKVKDLPPKKNPKGGRDPQSGLPTGQ